MKILILSDASSSHTLKWVNGLVKKDYDICLFSLVEAGSLRSAYDKKVKIETFNYDKNNIQKLNYFFWKKIFYLFALPRIWLAILKFKPDIIHAHYASSYGLLGSLSFKKPLIISLWGSDIFDFPQKNFISNYLTRFTLSKASIVLSTSHIMAKEGKKYTSKNIEVTPFGVDLNSFTPKKDNIKIQRTNNKLVIGIVKFIGEKYGISYLVKAFKIVSEKIKDQELELLIVGDGPQRKEIQDLVKELKLEHVTTFTGLVPHNQIVPYYQKIDIAVFPSICNSESFGVSVIEAGACEIPVIVSDVGGLPEVVDEGVTGLIFPKKNIEKLASALESLVNDKTKRKEMGHSARKRISHFYNWENNLQQMHSIYERTHNRSSNPQQI